MKKFALLLCTFVILIFSVSFVVNAQEVETENQTSTLTVSSVTLSKTHYVYNKDKVRTPKVTAVDSNGEQISPEYYTVKYQKGRKNVGTYTVTVEFKDKYSGSEKLKLKIVPQPTKITSLKSISKGIVVKWQKNTAQTTGYQIKCSKYSDFSKSTTFTVESNKKTSEALKYLSASTKYYVKIRAFKTVDGKKYYSSWSSKKSKTTLERITVFAGDSLSVGFYPSSYNGKQFLKMSGNILIYAHGGVNSSTFQTSKAFDNKTKTALQKIIEAKPYRVYIMLGMNEVCWRSLDDVSASYKKMIDTIKKKSPYTDIVLLAMTPVTKSKASKSPNFKKVGSYNKNLKKIAEENDVAYYDFTSEFVTSDGYLKSSYCGSADGIHWNINTYREFGKLITEYDSKRDEKLKNKYY